jgi:hypothetical protein
MSALDGTATHRGPTTGPGDPLVPLLPMEGGAPDPVAVAMWHLALGATTAVEVPHDLFALWLFPASGGVVLLGPQALAHDQVVVPLPEPHLLQDQLFQLEEVLRRAKYASAIAVPIHHADRDHGVMLLGSFGRGAFGPTQAMALQRLAARISPTFARLAETMPSATPHAALEPEMTLEELPDHLARTANEAASGPDLVRRVSGVLYPLLPHDRLEILATGVSDHAFFPLSGNPPKRRWSVGGGVVEPFSAIAERFGTAKTLLLDDLSEGEPEGEWAVGSGGAPAQVARALLGARLEVGGQLVGFLLLGSVSRDAYRPEDEDTLATAGRLLAPRVAGLRLAAEVEGLRAQVQAADTPALPLIRAADALAGTSHLGEALARFSQELRTLVPHQRIVLHLRWGEGEVIALDPDAPRPFADLPAMPVDTFEGAPLLRGERQWLVRSTADGEEILVPLRVAGRPIGTLGLRGPGFMATGEAAATAQQFANVLAPHLELLRRGAAAVAPRPGVMSPR